MKVTKAPEIIRGGIFRYAKDGKFVILLSKHTFIVNDKEIVVPADFRTDLASVPRIFWLFISPIGKHSIAAVMHDYIYSLECELNIHRKEADMMFYYVMLHCHVHKFTAALMYCCVRLFGASKWKKN